MYRDDKGTRGRKLGAALAAVGVQLVFAAALIWGLAVDPATREPRGAVIAAFDVSPPPSPEPEPSAQDSQAGPAGATGRRGEALPVEAPVPQVTLAPEPAAPVAGEGADTSAGSATRGSGPGSGTGGAGSGAGGVGSGAGGIATPAQRIAGALRDRDYPRALEAQRIGGTVRISFRVRTDGRVTGCTVTGSSGNAELDALTCRLFTERYRFRPAMTARGRPVESTLQTSFTWGTRRR